MRGARGEDKQGFETLGASPAFDPFQQFIAATTVTVFRVHGQAGQFTGVRIGDLVQRRTGNDHPFTLDHAELLDFALQHFTRAAHQNPLLFQRTDQIQQTANVFDGRLAQQFELLLGHQRTAAVTGEQLGQ
ncbi:hypothetical protein D3C75_961270 [compost metagenome]